MPPRIAVDETRLRELWGVRPALRAADMAHTLGICRSLLYQHAARLTLPLPRPRPPRRIGPVYHYAKR